MHVLNGFLTASFGVAFFHFLSLPLPWLLGPLTFCLVAALAGIRLKAIAPVSHGMRVVLGVAVGSAFTPAVLASLPGMWPTLLLIPLTVVLIGLCGIPYFERFCGYDRTTAYFATMPGGLTDMVLLGEEAGGCGQRQQQTRERKLRSHHGLRNGGVVREDVLR